MESVDADFSAYAERAILDDVVADEDPWPPDLEPLMAVHLARIVACSIEQQYFPRAPGIMAARGIESLRDAACRCDDATCTLPILDRLHEEEVEERLPRQPEEEERFRAADEAARVCIRPVLTEQLAADMNAFRASACACADATCADGVLDAMDVYARKAVHWPTEKSAYEPMKEVGEKIGACLQAARAASP